MTVGLLTEAFIFAYSAFFEPIEEDLDWTQVYPELVGGTAKEKDPNAKGILTQRLDDMLKEAKLGRRIGEKVLSHEHSQIFKERQKV